MKLIISFLFIFLGITILRAQPLNNSFEDWTSGMPDNWFTTGSPSVTQASVAYNGSSSVKMEVIDLGGFAFIPVMQSLDATANGHPVSEKHGALHGWYQFMPQGNDGIIITVIMQEGQSNPVGGGGLIIPAATSGWTQFTVPIFYFPGSPDPDNTIISIIIADTTGGGSEIGTVGSMGYIDYLTFTGPSSVEQIGGLPQDFSLSQNYPNPFNPLTNIEYTIPEASFVQLKVYDILGKEVATLVNEEQSAGTYRADFTAENLASGLYITKLQAGSHTKTIKMSLLK